MKSIHAHIEKHSLIVSLSATQESANIAGGPIEETRQNLTTSGSTRRQPRAPTHLWALGFTRNLATVMSPRPDLHNLFSINRRSTVGTAHASQMMKIGRHIDGRRESATLPQGCHRRGSLPFGVPRVTTSSDSLLLDNAAGIGVVTTGGAVSPTFVRLGVPKDLSRPLVVDDETSPRVD